MCILIFIIISIVLPTSIIKSQNKTIPMQIGGHDSRIYDQQQLIHCPNCHHRFPIDRLQLHEAYCTRNFKKCQMCGLMVDRNQFEEHHKEQHTQSRCEFCAETFMGRELEMHLQICMAKPVNCPYCMKVCGIGQLKSHEQACAARAKNCNICRKRIPFKQYEGHVLRCDARHRQRRENSQQQRNNSNNRDQLVRQTSQNNLNLQQKRRSPRKAQVKQSNTPSSNCIGREQIKQNVNPIPISIQITLREKQRENSRRPSLQPNLQNHSNIQGNFNGGKV